MKILINWIKIFRFWIVHKFFRLIDWSIPLRYRLFKQRLSGFIITWILFILTYMHLEYVFKVFAYDDKLTKGTLYAKLFIIHASWYVKEVNNSLAHVLVLFVVFNIYFIISTFSLSVYGIIGKYKEDASLAFAMGFLVFHDWFVTVYVFYILQVNVIILACFLYNLAYWVFHLIMWDEEMEAYYENQVELANKGREDFKHHGDNATVETVLKSKENAEYRDNSYTDENRPKLYEVISTEDVTFDEWMKEQGNPYIDEKSLQLKGAYVEDGVVEAVWDLEERYMKHFEMFYTEEDNYQPPGNNYAHVDLEIDHENINYLKMFPIYLWEDKKYWETLNKYDKYRVILIAIYYFITKKAFKRPKVVGPYRIYTPFYRVDGKSLADWERLQWMVFIKRLVLKLFSLLSIRQRYHSIKWFLFRVKFVPQLKALRKRKSSNYNFFKNKPKE